MAYSPHTPPASTREPYATRQAGLILNSAEDADASAILTTFISTLPGRAELPIQRASVREPPKYDELYPSTPGPASRCRLSARPSPPKGMDPLVAAMWHNENLSFLHSLPDSSLLKIIRLLKNRGVECLRRVARRFPPLCVREVLNPLRGPYSELSKTGPFNWPRFVGAKGSPRPAFLYLIDRDEYCSGCQAARRSPRWEQRLGKLIEYIHCSACGVDHPACLFSATQRLKPSRFRYCIAHQGFMRVCEHEAGAISLSRLSGLESQCEPRRRWPWQRKNPWQTILCRDKSHLVLCANFQGGAFPKCKCSLESKMGLCTGYAWPMAMGSEDLPNLYHLGWTAHTPWDGQITTRRSWLEETYENAGRYIVPCSATAKETPALRCFDPNDCHCTYFAGSEHVRWEYECGPWLPGKTKCIYDPYRGLDTLQPPEPPESTGAKIIRRLKKQQPSRCVADQKRHQSRPEYVPYKRGVGYSAVDARLCHKGKDCLKVDYFRDFYSHDEGGRITPQWYNALDPESYNITEDEDGLGVFWCHTAGCRNYYKGVLNYAGILRHREFHRDCRHHNYR